MARKHLQKVEEAKTTKKRDEELANAVLFLYLTEGYHDLALKVIEEECVGLDVTEIAHPLSLHSTLVKSVGDLNSKLTEGNAVLSEINDLLASAKERCLSRMIQSTLVTIRRSLNDRENRWDTTRVKAPPPSGSEITINKTTVLIAEMISKMYDNIKACGIAEAGEEKRKKMQVTSAMISLFLSSVCLWQPPSSFHAMVCYNNFMYLSRVCEGFGLSEIALKLVEGAQEVYYREVRKQQDEFIMIVEEHNETTDFALSEKHVEKMEQKVKALMEEWGRAVDHSVLIASMSAAVEKSLIKIVDEVLGRDDIEDDIAGELAERMRRIQMVCTDADEGIEVFPPFCELTLWISFDIEQLNEILDAITMENRNLSADQIVDLIKKRFVASPQRKKLIEKVLAAAND